MLDALTILGSTGSIGQQALEVCENLQIPVATLIAGSNILLLEKQIRRYKPMVAIVADEKLAKVLRTQVADTLTEVYGGRDAILNAMQDDRSSMVLTSVVGITGLEPTLTAIRAGKHIALANKETLVAAGHIVMREAQKNKVRILPVDSEHSAIFQCLDEKREQAVSKIILTASGGPFRGYTLPMLEQVTLEQALKHPNWAMGNKITIDSATMMNKGLEVIEARWLFGLTRDQIEVVVHPQSIIHSMVEYNDGSVIAQLGAPDMRIPIQYALTWPQRMVNPFNRMDICKTGTLTFEKPELHAFRCLQLAFDALEIGGSMPCVMNAANEVAVDAFLKGKIRFLDIASVVEEVMLQHQMVTVPLLDEIMAADRWAREATEKKMNQI